MKSQACWHGCRFVPNPSRHFKCETELESKCRCWTWIVWSGFQCPGVNAFNPVNLIMWLRWVNQVMNLLDVGQCWFEVTVWDLLIQVTEQPASGKVGHAPDPTPTCKTNRRLHLISLMKVQNHRRWSWNLIHCNWESNQDNLSSMCYGWWFNLIINLSVCVCSSQDRLQSLVFGLLRQRKLDFLDIYSEEMVRAAKNVVRQVQHMTDTRDGAEKWKIRSKMNVSLSSLQCVVKSVSQISEIDADTVKWVMNICIQCKYDSTVYHSWRCVCVWCRFHEQMRLMTFHQWFDLLLDIFEHFILFLKRIKVT